MDGLDQTLRLPPGVDVTSLLLQDRLCVYLNQNRPLNTGEADHGFSNRQVRDVTLLIGGEVKGGADEFEVLHPRHLVDDSDSRVLDDLGGDLRGKLCDEDQRLPKLAQLRDHPLPHRRRVLFSSSGNDVSRLLDEDHVLEPTPPRNSMLVDHLQKDVHEDRTRLSVSKVAQLDAEGLEIGR